MIEKLNPHYSMNNPSSAYDEEALTALELVGRTTAKLNEIVDSQNKLVVYTEEELNNHKTKVIPETVNKEVENHIANGDFDEQINMSLGNLTSQTENRLKTIESRVNNLTANAGDVSNNTELLDLRVGVDGKTYANAGTALRTQLARNLADFCTSHTGVLVNVDLTNKQIVMYRENNGFAYLSGNNYRWQSEDSDDFICSINPPSYGVVYAVVFNASLKTLRVEKIDQAPVSNNVYQSGDIILFTGFFTTTAVLSICGDTEIIRVNGERVKSEKTHLYTPLGFADTVAFHFNGLTLNISSGFVQVERGVFYNFEAQQIDCTSINGKTAQILFDITSKTFILTAGELAHNYANHVLIMNLWYFGGNVYRIYAPYCVKDVCFVNGKKVLDSVVTSGLNKHTVNIFKKVVCCGDSYTSGHMTDSNGVVHASMPDYAYPHFMEKLTGNEWLNCGVSGANVLTWQTNSGGFPKAQSIGKAQAYIVGLMINDNGDWGGFVNLGSPSDIGTNAQTYYGGLSQIVTKLHGINPLAKIFICTCPRNESGYTERNQAVKDVCNHYKSSHNTHCLDLHANIELYQNTTLTNDAKDGHFTSIGYEQFAEILSVILSNYINENTSDFQDVPFIPYD